MADLASLEQRALAELQACTDEAALRAWNTRYFGKQGEVVAAVKAVGSVPKEERREYGQKANQVKETLTQAHDKAQADMKERALDRAGRRRAADCTSRIRRCAKST